VLAKLFPEKRQPKRENREEVWAVAIMVSVSSKLVTLLLFIAAISISGCVVFTDKMVLKVFSELNPKYVPIVSDT